MADVLTRILDAKRREVELARGRVPIEEIRRRAAQASAPRGFEAALRRKRAQGQHAVIA